MKIGTELKIITQKESQPDPKVIHHFFKGETVYVVMIATDKRITAESEDSGEWELEDKDYEII